MRKVQIICTCVIPINTFWSSFTNAIYILDLSKDLTFLVERLRYLIKGTDSSQKPKNFQFLFLFGLRCFSIIPAHCVKISEPCEACNPLSPNQLKRIATVQSGASVLCRGEPSIARFYFHFSWSLLKLERCFFCVLIYTIRLRLW